MSNSSILWRRLDQPGHDLARLYFKESAWHLAGTAVFAYKRQPCQLDYLVICDERWQTVSGRVSGWVGDMRVQIALAVDAERRWWLNGREYPAVAGCIDLDLSFSPATNLLPIRRLELAVGQGAGVRAAWLRFPGFGLEPLGQSYRRIAAATYWYEVEDYGFIRELVVNGTGFVTDYPDLWTAEAAG